MGATKKRKNLYWLFLLIPILVAPFFALLANKQDDYLKVIKLTENYPQSHTFLNVNDSVIVNILDPISGKYYWDEIDNRDYEDYLKIEDQEPFKFKVTVIKEFTENYFKFEIHNIEYSSKYYVNFVFKDIYPEEIILSTSEVVF